MRWKSPGRASLTLAGRPLLANASWALSLGLKGGTKRKEGGEGPPPPAEIALGRALPIRGPAPGSGRLALGSRALFKEMPVHYSLLRLYLAPSLSPGQGRGCHYGEAAGPSPKPHPRGPLPFTSPPPRRAGLGFPPPEKAELK